ncbi:hypothetical protein KR215_003651, partial [Drosophila sulfurigaster]
SGKKKKFELRKLLYISLQIKTIIEFTKFDCVNQWPEILQIQCHINRTSKNISAIYAVAIFSEEIKNMDGRYIVGVEYNQKVFNYLTIDVDYCAALHMAYSQNWLQLVVVGLRSVANFPFNCPLKKNYTYFVNGFTMDMKKVPAYMPEISFITNATFFYNKRSFFYVTCMGRVYR